MSQESSAAMEFVRPLIEDIGNGGPWKVTSVSDEDLIPLLSVVNYLFSVVHKRGGEIQSAQHIIVPGAGDATHTFTIVFR